MAATLHKTAPDSTEPQEPEQDHFDPLRQVAYELVPPLAAAVAFIAGLALLNSAAQPALPGRLAALMNVWPLEVVELSHFLASVVGVLLILVAGGLWRRLDGAYWLAIALLGAGALFSLLKALDYEEALGLSLGAALLVPCRSAFFRRSELTQALVRGPWALGLVFALAGMVWVFLSSYEHTTYSDELWWTFLLNAEASRSIRATGAAVIAGLFAFGMAALVPHRKIVKPEQAQNQRALAAKAFASAEAARGEANLLYTGDHDVVLTPSGKSFVLYAARGSSYVAMGDPVGPVSERGEALLDFHALAIRQSANPVLYSFSADLLETVVDLGYTIRKIGESAKVELKDFSLEGSARQKLRNVRNKLTREGYRLTVSAPGEVKDWATLKAISDAWLATHQGKEKAFSLGRFDQAYLSHFPIAIIAKEGEPPVAFASLWPTPDRGDIAVDLMRQSPSAPAGAMDFMFIEAMAWAKGQGYQWFDLGMAPLSGLPASRYAPVLNRLGAAIFERGEDIYGFQGLRAYKQKFQPTWCALFIAAPPSVSLPLALLDVALLTSRGWLGIFRR